MILEVNPHMPRVFGDCTIHVSQVTALVEHAAPLLEVPKAAPQPADTVIGGIIAGLIEDGSTLQMGIGALPDAVCAALHDHRDLGYPHRDDDARPGRPDEGRRRQRRRKTLHPGKAVFAFCMGDQDDL